MLLWSPILAGGGDGTGFGELWPAETASPALLVRVELAELLELVGLVGLGRLLDLRREGLSGMVSWILACCSNQGCLARSCTVQRCVAF